MLRQVRYFISGIGHWLARHRWHLAAGFAGLIALGGAGAAGYLIADPGDEEPISPAPEIVVREQAAPEVTEELGFPAFATRNTTRIASSDAVAAAAAVALAVYPSTGGVSGPAAVTLVDADDWHAGIAAASLVAEPIGAPLLVTEDGDVPELTEAALDALSPSGSSATDEREAFRIGDAADPGELNLLDVEGPNPAQVAADIERLRTRLGGDPDHLLLVSSDDPAFAMPAAGWAARSGDPVLYVQRDSVPASTRRALQRHEGAPVYVLGPQSAISPRAFREIRELAPGVRRVAGENPVANSIAFSRYADGTFGWNINDPGHGLVIANAERPLDAAVASPLSATGTWGPLLVTDDSDVPSGPLRGYLLDLKPGYDDDPTRAVYNHVWFIGDLETISVGFQAQVDELVELVRVGPGRGPGAPGPRPDRVRPDPNDEPEPDQVPEPDED